MGSSQCRLGQVCQGGRDAVHHIGGDVGLQVERRDPHELAAILDPEHVLGRWTGVAGLRRQDRGGQAGGAVLNVDPGCGEQVPNMTRVGDQMVGQRHRRAHDSQQSAATGSPVAKGVDDQFGQVLVVCGTGGLGKSDRAQQGLIGVGGVDQCPCEAVVLDRLA